MEITLDLDQLNLGEVDFIETESGLTINDLAEGKMNTRALMAVVVVLEHKKGNAAYSMTDAAHLKVSEIEVERVDPTEAAPTTKTKSRKAPS